MYKGNKVVGLVPARGGSKRLPNKNIMKFVDKPLIAWSIKAGQESKYIDKVVVSTEDCNVAEVAKNANADLVIPRPTELAGDNTSSLDVAFHALDYLAGIGETFTYLSLLQPTSPLRTSNHIDAAFELMDGKSACSIIGVCVTEHPIHWMGSVPRSLALDNFSVCQIEAMTEIEDSYQINGAIYLIRVDTLFESCSFFPRQGAFAYIMDRQHSIDIDTPLDFFVAECLHKKLEGSG